MGDRLRDYGFMNPFRSNPQGSNYNANLAYLSGSGVDQWLVDTAAYNKIIKDFGLTSQIEYKQKDGSWSTVAPQKPSEKLELIRAGSFGSEPRFVTNSGRSFSPGSFSPGSTGQLIQTMPEYRWVISGDVAGANNALMKAGLQGSYTGPRGDKFITGAYIPTEIKGANVTAFSPTQGGGMAQTGGRNVGLRYIDSPDPLGIGLGGNNNASNRAYGGKPAPVYYIGPSVSSERWSSAIMSGRPGVMSTTLNTDLQKIANEIFKNPNLGNLIYQPNRLKNALSKTPAIRDQIGQYINDTAAYYRSRDDGGGALGVIAKGLSGVAQFASMASGLNALVTGLGSLASGAGLKGAFGAAMNAAKGMPDIGSVVGGAAGSPAIGNLANIGVGGITGAEKGGLTGGLLGAGGAAVGAGIDQAGGVREFVKNPLGNIAGAVGLGGLGGFTPAQIAAMEQASKVGLGSVAQNTTGGSLSPTGEYVPLQGGYAILPGGAGQIPEIGITGPATGVGAGGAGSSLTGNIGSAFLGGAAGLSPFIFGGGGKITGAGAPSFGASGGLPGRPAMPGNIASTGVTGSTGGTGTTVGAEGFGEIGPDGMPIGTPGPYSDAYGQGTTESDFQTQKMFGMLPSLSLGMGGPWNYTGMPSGAGAGTGTGAVGTTGLLNTGTGGGGLSGTGIGGGDGLGGDGAGGGGLGGDGLGMGSGGLDYSGLLGGMTPGTMGDPVSFLTPRPIGVKKKGPVSFYGKLQAPKRRKGITVRRA